MASILDNSLFHNTDFSILLHMHVDDGPIVGKSRMAILNVLDDLKRTYSLKINKKSKQHLGYTFDWWSDGLLYIHQADFVQKILDEFNMSNTNPVKSLSPLIS
jgi:hypothetical protein